MRRLVRRGFLVALTGLAALVATVAAFFLLEIDSPRLGRAVLERAGLVSGAKLTARGFSLRPLSGLVLDGVEASATFAGGRATVSLDSLVFAHRLWPLITGRLAVDRIVFRRPRIRLVETAAARPGTAAASALPAGALGRLSLRITEIAVEDGSIELLALGQRHPLIVRGLDLRLQDLSLEPSRASLMAGLSARGEVRAAEVISGPTRARDARGGLSLGGGRLQTDTIRFRTDQGPFEARFTFDLDRLPLAYAFSVKGDPLDVNTLTKARPGGGGFGRGALELEAKGVGTEAAGLSGKGLLKLQAGTLPGTPLLSALERAVGRTRIVGARYRATDAPFRLERGRVVLDGFRLEADPVALEMAGWASLSGPFEFSVALHAPREGLRVSGIGEDALDLLTDEQGRVLVPFKVTGTQEAPTVRPDATALAAQARRGGARALADRAGRALGGLFRRKPR